MRRRTSKTLTALTAAAALTLPGCGTDTEDVDPGLSPTGAEPSAQVSDPGPTGGDASATATETNDGEDPAPAAVAGEVPAEVGDAIRTAEREAGGTAYEFDDQDDDGSWEVDVAAGDRSVEVTVSADGTEVLEVEDDDLDDEDREALSSATITITDAIAQALTEVPGTLDDVELDDEGDSFTWEVTVDAEDHDDVEVYVDVVSGEVVRVDR